MRTYTNSWHFAETTAGCNGYRTSNISTILFTVNSLVRHNMETTAMGCVCLASKIEEAPRRIRDVINVFNHIKQVSSQKPIQPVILDQNYVALKNQVIKSERRVLKELGFCVHVKHPHKIIVMYLQVLGYEKNHALMQQCLELYE